MAATKTIIQYLQSNMANLLNLILDTANFKAALISSLEKFSTSQTPDFHYSSTQKDSDSQSDSSTDITTLTKSVMEAINQYSNFNGTIEKSNLFKNLSSNYWNSSVRNAIENFQDLASAATIPASPEDLVGNTYVSYEDLKKANAGYTFINSVFSSNPVQLTPWVKPNINMYQSSYGSTRNEGQEVGDAALSVLRHIGNLQFTHTQEQQFDWRDINKNIRLLMPKNAHRVEVEDLNRNFWVITQTIAAISGFLFGDPKKSYLGELEFLLDEIIQLWDNVLWIWILLLNSIAEENQIHIEEVAIYDGDESYTRSYERHLDKFYLNRIHQTTDGQVRRTLDQLAQKYPNRNLVILIQERKNNYMWEYFDTISFPYLCVKEKQGAWKKYRLCAHIPAANEIFSGEVATDNFEFSINNFFGVNISSKIGQIHENGRTHTYHYPATSLPQQNQRWFGALRVTPRITAELVDGHIKINTFEIKIFDAASLGQEVTSSTENTYFNTHFYNFAITEPFTVLMEEDTLTLKGTKGTLPILKSNDSTFNYAERNNKAFYLGELVSKIISN